MNPRLQSLSRALGGQTTWGHALLAILLLGAIPAAVHAADGNPPTRLSYQGYLVDGNGIPLGNTAVKNYDVVFRIYNVSQGGTSLWAEQQTVTVSQGNFSVLLGEGNAVPSEPNPVLDTVFVGADASDRFVGITVKGLGGATNEIAPRLRFLSNPYAFLARNANALSTPGGQTLFNFDNGGLQSIGGNARGSAAIDLQVTRIDPAQVASGNWSFIGGGQNNRASADAATVAGGTANNNSAINATIGGGYSNTVSALHATIAGGSLNTVSAVDATVGGGHLNRATSINTTVGGGFVNLAAGDFATIAGGNQNTNTGAGGAVGGGTLNILTGGNCVIGGGLQNTNAGLTSTIGGGYQNYAAGRDTFIGGGHQNTNTAFVSTIAGGQRNQATADGATVGGGFYNLGRGVSSVIAGGAENTVWNLHGSVLGGFRNSAAADYSSVGGGANNTNYSVAGVIAGGADNLTGVDAATIGGGRNNRATAQSSTVAGGVGNRSTGIDSTIGGGYNNLASGLRSTVSGGVNSTASGVDAAVAGGDSNVASGMDSFVSGGYLNVASGATSWAGGRKAKSYADGTFTWSDRVDIDFAPNFANSFNVRAVGGIHFYSNGTGWLDAARTGVFLAPNANSWAFVSDRNAKKNFTPIDYKDVLEKLDKVPVTAWHYKAESDDSTKNIGPVAQDFKATFYPGRDDKSITTLELDGVQLAAIKGLRQVVQEQQKEIDELKQQLKEIRGLVTKLAAQPNVAAR